MKRKVLSKAAQFEQLALEMDLGLIGSLAQNHLRVTPLGGLQHTWLSANSVPTLGLTEEKFPHKHIAVLGIESYHDFQPHLLAENLKQNHQFTHCEVTTALLSIPKLDQLRENSREFRSINISQLLEHRLERRELINEIKQVAKGADCIFLPACFGLDDQKFVNQLKQDTGLNLYELPTLPPSLLGIRQHKQLLRYFQSLGGLMLNGDKAIKAVIENNQVKQIFTQLHQEHGIQADNFVLSSGSFFSNGLASSFERIFEPLFDADITGNNENFKSYDRLTWTTSKFASPQPYQSAGIAINNFCQVQKSGQILQNLYAAGNVIGGYNALELGCGSGVSIVTALCVADNILNQ